MTFELIKKLIKKYWAEVLFVVPVDRKEMNDSRKSEMRIPCLLIVGYGSDDKNIFKGE